MTSEESAIISGMTCILEIVCPPPQTAPNPLLITYPAMTRNTQFDSGGEVYLGHETPASREATTNIYRRGGRQRECPRVATEPTEPNRTQTRTQIQTPTHDTSTIYEYFLLHPPHLPLLLFSQPASRPPSHNERLKTHPMPILQRDDQSSTFGPPSKVVQRKHGETEDIGIKRKIEVLSS